MTAHGPDISSFIFDVGSSIFFRILDDILSWSSVLELDSGWLHSLLMEHPRMDHSVVISCALDS